MTTTTDRWADQDDGQYRRPPLDDSPYDVSYEDGHNYTPVVPRRRRRGDVDDEAEPLASPLAEPDLDDDEPARGRSGGAVTDDDEHGSAIWTGVGVLVVAVGAGSFLIFNAFGGWALVTAWGAVTAVGGTVAAVAGGRGHRDGAGRAPRTPTLKAPKLKAPKLKAPKLTGGRAGSGTGAGRRASLLGKAGKGTGAGRRAALLGKGKAGTGLGAAKGRKTTGSKMPGLGGSKSRTGRSGSLPKILGGTKGRKTAGTGPGRGTGGAKGRGLPKLPGLPKILGGKGRGASSTTGRGRRGGTTTGGPGTKTGRGKLPGLPKILGGKGRRATTTGPGTPTGRQRRGAGGPQTKGTPGTKPTKGTKPTPGTTAPPAPARTRWGAAHQARKAARQQMRQTRQQSRQQRRQAVRQRHANNSVARQQARAARWQRRRAVVGAHVLVAAWAARYAARAARAAVWRRSGGAVARRARAYATFYAAWLRRKHRRNMRKARFAVRLAAMQRRRFFAAIAARLPRWMTELRELAKRDGKRAAFGAAVLASWLAFLGFLRSVVWDTNDAAAGRHGATGRRVTVTAADSTFGGTRSGRTPHAVVARPVPQTTTPAHPAPATTTPRPVAPAPTPAPATTRTGGTRMHPNHRKMVEASHAYVVQYRPRNVPDFWRYLNSQPVAMLKRAEHIDTLAARLDALFPGTTLIRGHFRSVSDGLRGMAQRAHALREAYATVHKADLDRFKNLRVNEHYADIDGHGSAIPVLDDGTIMHECHSRTLEYSRLYVASYFPGESNPDQPDRVLDFIDYLATMPEMYRIHALDMKGFATHLVSAYPVEVEIHDYYDNLAGGYGLLADRSAGLEDHYRTVAAHDVRRREDPLPNERWRDVTNVGQHS
jgi:hypothetical protein